MSHLLCGPSLCQVYPVSARVVQGVYFSPSYEQQGMLLLQAHRKRTGGYRYRGGSRTAMKCEICRKNAGGV